MKIIHKEYYRSKPMVNMTDDLVRITITAKRHELRELERFIEGRLMLDNDGDVLGEWDLDISKGDSVVLSGIEYIHRMKVS